MGEAVVHQAGRTEVVVDPLVCLLDLRNQLRDSLVTQAKPLARGRQAYARSASLVLASDRITSKSNTAVASCGQEPLGTAPASLALKKVISRLWRVLNMGKGRVWCTYQGSVLARLSLA